MRKHLHATGALLGALCCVSGAATPLVSQPASVLFYLPDEAVLEGWEALGDPQTAEGDDLFLLINGGAEIYNEFGFVRAVMHSYDKGDRSVNLEIYEMEDVASAYGAYSFKTGRGGESLDIGSEARFEEYYLNFWKGNVVVTLVGFDTDEETREALLALAGLVEAKIAAVGPRPDIVGLLPETSASGVPVHPTYVEGNLGLFNRYRFGTDDLFGLSQAAVGDYGEYLLFAIPYDNTTAAGEQFVIASKNMSESGLFSDVVVGDSEFAAVDRDKRCVSLRTAREFLIAYVGNEANHASGVLDTLYERVIRNPTRQD